MTPANETVDLVEARRARRRHRVIVLTGDPGSGKSTHCRQVVLEAREAGLVARGIVGFDEADAGGVKRWQEDVGSGRQLLLGRATSAEEISAGASRWELEDAALEECSRILTSACPADLLVIDEVGPLELLHGRGMLAGVRHALTGHYEVALVVVRPDLIPRFTELFPLLHAEVVDVRENGALRRLRAAALAGQSA
jgi:nucleoside-triphosphatase THEP1